MANLSYVLCLFFVVGEVIGEDVSRTAATLQENTTPLDAPPRFEYKWTKFKYGHYLFGDTSFEMAPCGFLAYKFQWVRGRGNEWYPGFINTFFKFDIIKCNDETIPPGEGTVNIAGTQGPGTFDDFDGEVFIAEMHCNNLILDAGTHDRSVQPTYKIILPLEESVTSASGNLVLNKSDIGVRINLEFSSYQVGDTFTIRAAPDRYHGQFLWDGSGIQVTQNAKFFYEYYEPAYSDEPPVKTISFEKTLNKNVMTVTLTCPETDLEYGHCEGELVLSLEGLKDRFDVVDLPVEEIKPLDLSNFFPEEAVEDARTPPLDPANFPVFRPTQPSQPSQKPPQEEPLESRPKLHVEASSAQRNMNSDIFLRLACFLSNILHIMMLIR